MKTMKTTRMAKKKIWKLTEDFLLTVAEVALVEGWAS